VCASNVVIVMVVVMQVYSRVEGERNS
jgi:hypothetical protein